MSALVDLTGRVFNRWEVLGPGRKPAGLGSLGYYEKAWWECRCRACGTVRPVLSQSLRSGASRSCGCLRIERNVARRRRAPGAGATLQAGAAGMVSMTGHAAPPVPS